MTIDPGRYFAADASVQQAVDVFHPPRRGLLEAMGKANPG